MAKGIRFRDILETYAAVFMNKKVELSEDVIQFHPSSVKENCIEK